MKMNLKLILICCLCFVKVELSFQCSLYSENITCICSNFSVSCSGIQKNVTEIQDIFSNISNHYSQLLPSVEFNIEGLHFETDFKFENMDIKNLSIRYGLQTLNDDFLSGLGLSLEFLNLTHNNIQQIKNQPFSALVSLKALALDYNSLSEISKDIFYNLSHLEILSISGNKITELEENVFEYLPSIKTLVLDHNDIALLSKVNFKSPTMHKLQVRNCSLEGVLENDLLSKMSELVDLDFSYNKITEVKSYALSSLKNLNLLNLSYNTIEVIQENAFSSLHSLSKLDLKDNHVSIIMKTAFISLVNLQSLDLSGNKLTVVHSDYTSYMISLENIYLQNNEIKTIMDGTFSNSSNLKELNLEGNRLDCTCELLNIVHLIKTKTNVPSKNIDSLHCYRNSDFIAVTEYHNITENDADEFCDNDEDYSMHNASGLVDSEDENISTISTSVTAVYSETSTKSSSIHSTENLSTTSTSVTTVYSETSTKPSSIHSTEISTQLNVSSETDSYGNVTFASTDTSKYDTSLDSKTETTSSVPFVTSNSKMEESYSDSTTENSMIGVKTETTTISSSQRTTNSAIASTVAFSTVDLAGNKGMAVPVSICDSLNVSSEISNSSTEVKISQQFLQDISLEEEKFCLKWSVSGTVPDKSKCFVRYVYSGGRKSETFKCPVSNEIKQWSSTQIIYQFCIIIKAGSQKVGESCENVVKKPENSSSSETESSEYSTKIPSTSVSADKTEFASVSENISSSTSVSAVSLLPPDNASTAFNVSFDVHFSKKFSKIVWNVNKDEPASICTLTLDIVTQTLNERKFFNCTNSFLIVENLNERETFTICLASDHKYDEEVSLCKSHSSNPSVHSKASKSKDKTYETYALMPLICLLILVLLIILAVVFKNIYRKRLESDKYEVRVEEEKVKRRMASSADGRSSVRYSYSAKEQADV